MASILRPHAISLSIYHHFFFSVNHFFPNILKINVILSVYVAANNFHTHWNYTKISTNYS